MALAERELHAQQTEAGQPERRRFTREEYYKMAESGILDEDERVELIHGDIVTMAPIGPDHNSSSLDLYDLITQSMTPGLCVMYERPIVMDDETEPEPDLIVVRGDRRDFRERHPAASEVAVVIETSKSSLPRDRKYKLRLYAESTIPEYWIVNMVDKQVEVYTEPNKSGYDHVHTYRSGESIPLSFAPGKSIAVADIL